MSSTEPSRILNLGEIQLSSLTDEDVVQHFADCAVIVIQDASSAKSHPDPPPLEEIVQSLDRLGSILRRVEEIDFGDALWMNSGGGNPALARALEKFRPHLKSVVASDCGSALLDTLLAGNFPDLRKIWIKSAVGSVASLKPFGQLESLRLRIGADASDLDLLKTEFPNLKSLSIKEIDEGCGGGGNLDAMRLFQKPGKIGELEELVLEEQRGGGGNVNAVYPNALRDVFTSCPKLKKLKMLITFDGGQCAENPFQIPKHLVDLHLRLAFPYGVDVDVRGFADQIVDAFEDSAQRPLRSLSFHSYDHALQRLYGCFFERILGDGTKPRVLVDALACISWDVESAASWLKLKAATSAMKGLKKLCLTVRMPQNAKQEEGEQIAANQSVEEIVVDFLAVERNQIVTCCFGSSDNVRSGSTGPSSTSSASFFSSFILPHFPKVTTLHFDNFKTLDFSAFIPSSSSSSASAKLPPTLRRLLSPTTTINFRPGDFKLLVDVCGANLEEFELGFASGIPVEEMESLLRLPQLKTGYFQCEAFEKAKEIGADLDLNDLKDQKTFHERMINRDFQKALKATSRQLRALHLFFDVIPVGAEYKANMKNGVSTGATLRKSLNQDIEISTMDWS